ncbi:hypothetical protein GRF29_1g154216 [Pseudopithomyces chartarum]|uniref:Secreted protein n=1 Tax=Pseudopithomyces chartarum TaxID=1892770 RepID=A0AAN6RLU4_9PLEO|nr:hypothetical protein GRF29_1g154216 [Pseudopithomyces chartarum]
MQLSAILLTFIATTAVANPLPDSNVGYVNTLSARGCFGSGASWGNRQDKARDAAKRACKERLGKPTGYLGNEQRSYCANLGGNVKVNFNIKRIGNSKQSLDFNACYDGLRKEIEGCNHGGRTKYANWEYTSTGPMPILGPAKMTLPVSPGSGIERCQVESMGFV